MKTLWNLLDVEKNAPLKLKAYQIIECSFSFEIPELFMLS